MALPVENRMQTHAVIPTVRLGKQLNDEKRDPGDGHGAASSPDDLCCGQGGDSGIFWGGADHSFGSWGEFVGQTWFLCWLENWHLHLPHPCIEEVLGGFSLGSFGAFA